jgi:hypothetical protein
MANQKNHENTRLHKALVCHNFFLICNTYTYIVFNIASMYAFEAIFFVKLFNENIFDHEPLLTIVPSMSFYPDFILMLSRFHPDFI